MLADRFGAEITVGKVITYPYRQSSTLKNVDGVVVEVHEESGKNKVKVQSVDPWSGRQYHAWVKCVDRITVLPYSLSEFMDSINVKLGV
jgi:ribosomal protein L35AE/L33A